MSLKSIYFHARTPISLQLYNYLGTMIYFRLYSLVTDGDFGLKKPYVCGSGTLKVAVEKGGHGFLLVRLLADIKNVDYSVAWYSKEDERMIVRMPTFFYSSNKTNLAQHLLFREHYNSCDYCCLF